MSRGTRKPSEVFSSVLENAESQLAVAAENAAGFRHKGIRGDERAGALIKFLRRHLPTKYGVGKGEAIDYKDRRSGQLDIIIFDQANSAPVLGAEENLLVPCEALLAVVEVKTTLTQDELIKSYKAGKCVRQLAPFKRRFVGPREGGAAADDNRSRCMYSLFSYGTNLEESDWLKAEFDRVEIAAQKTSAPLDAIERVAVLGRGMLNPSALAGKTVTGDDQGIFLEYYLNLVNFLDREANRRQAVDWQIYSGRNAKGWVKLR